jgi:hypothetical protein
MCHCHTGQNPPSTSMETSGAPNYKTKWNHRHPIFFQGYYLLKANTIEAVPKRGSLSLPLCSLHCIHALDHIRDLSIFVN